MNSESQQEELEVLRSIYDGDASFKEMGPCTFQYKVSKGIVFLNNNIGAKLILITVKNRIKNKNTSIRK